MERSRSAPAQTGVPTAPEILTDVTQALTNKKNLLYNALYMAARRTQIYLTAEQRKRLDERRRRERRTLAEIVRQAVDAYLTDRSVDPATALNSTFGALPNLEVPSRDEWDHA